MLLVEDGKLGLDDTLGKYLNELPPAWKGLTLRQLLTHTSGLKDWESANVLSYRREYTADEFIKLMSPFPLDFPPGERWSYTNTAYPLLGMVIERASGRNFEEFMAERIFKPLGMNATRFNHPSQIILNHASGYVEEKGRLRKGEPLRPHVIAPNGGMLTTVLDMAKWEKVFYTERLLKQSSLEQMQTPVRLNNGATFNSGLGLFMDTFRGQRLILHNGSTIAGFSSVFYRYPDDKLTVIVLCNIDQGNAVNVIATRVASFYGPKLTISALPEQKDPAPETSRRLLQMLSDLAQGKESELLSKEWGRLVSPETRAKIAEQLLDLKRVAFLESETPNNKLDRLGIAVKQINRYKLLSGRRTIYYTFELAEDGRVARLFFEEE
jgi:CubicO group peptidase (beta-lactamase class C family)